jgi:hypothetical protein
MYAKEYRLSAINIGAATYPQCEMPLDLVLGELGKKSKVLMS